MLKSEGVTSGYMGQRLWYFGGPLISKTIKVIIPVMLGGLQNHMQCLRDTMLSYLSYLILIVYDYTMFHCMIVTQWSTTFLKSVYHSDSIKKTSIFRMMIIGAFSKFHNCGKILVRILIPKHEKPCAKYFWEWQSGFQTSITKTEMTLAEWQRGNCILPYVHVHQVFIALGLIFSYKINEDTGKRKST